MRIARLSAVLVVVATAFPVAAVADAPWSTPVAIDGVTALLTTQIGGRILVGAPRNPDARTPTLVARVEADGSTAGRQVFAIAYAKAATFGRAGVVIAGSRPALTAAGAAKAPVVVALGSVRGLHGVGAPRALVGSGGQWVLAVAGNPASSTIAVVTSSMYNPGPPTRTLWVRRGRVFTRALTFRAGTNAREAAVSVGASGDVLVAWQGHRAVYARHVSRTGRVGPVQRLGAGVQSAIQARIDQDGRQEVAWESQSISEGYAATPAIVSYTSAAPGQAFTSAHVVGRSSLTGTGRYVSRPGVRLVAVGPSSSLLAWSVYDGTHFRVQVADVSGGVVASPQTVSPAGDDAVLGDLAASPAGGQLIAWRTGTRGNDASGPQRVAAAVRPPGAATFGPPELVSDPVAPPGTPAANATAVPQAPIAAVDIRGGHRYIAWATLEPPAKIAIR